MAITILGSGKDLEHSDFRPKSRKGTRSNDG